MVPSVVSLSVLWFIEWNEVFSIIPQAWAYLLYGNNVFVCRLLEASQINPGGFRSLFGLARVLSGALP
jgi:hypothetical protein